MMEATSRVDHKRPKGRFDEMQMFDFGIPENDYEWKTKGANRLLYNLMEQDRFARLKVNQKLPDHLMQNSKVPQKSQKATMDKTIDCTHHFSRMVEEFKDQTADRRDRPT